MWSLKKNFILSSVLTLTAITAVGISMNLSANAQTTSESSAKNTEQCMDQRMERRSRHGVGFFNMQTVKAQLQLTTAQEKLWQTAENLQKEMMQQFKNQERPGALWRNALQTEGFHPRKVAEQMDTLHEKRAAERKKVRDAWLKVYDSLQPEQQQTIITHWRNHDEKRMALHGERWFQ